MAGSPSAKPPRVAVRSPSPLRAGINAATGRQNDEWYDRSPRADRQVFTYEEDTPILRRVLGGHIGHEKGAARQAFMIGVAGGTASGKSTVCRRIVNSLADQRVVLLSQDSFYRGLSPKEKANAADFNFDHPDAFDIAELTRCLDSLMSGESVQVPIYDFTLHERSTETQESLTPAHFSHASHPVFPTDHRFFSHSLSARPTLSLSKESSCFIWRLC